MTVAWCDSPAATEASQPWLVPGSSSSRSQICKKKTCLLKVTSLAAVMQVAYLDGRITEFGKALEAQGLGPQQPVAAATQARKVLAILNWIGQLHTSARSIMHACEIARTTLGIGGTAAGCMVAAARRQQGKATCLLPVPAAALLPQHVTVSSFTASYELPGWRELSDHAAGHPQRVHCLPTRRPSVKTTKQNADMSPLHAWPTPLSTNAGAGPGRGAGVLRR